MMLVHLSQSNFISQVLRPLSRGLASQTHHKKAPKKAIDPDFPFPRPSSSRPNDRTTKSFSRPFPQRSSNSQASGSNRGPYQDKKSRSPRSQQHSFRTEGRPQGKSSSRGSEVGRREDNKKSRSAGSQHTRPSHSHSSRASRPRHENGSDSESYMQEIDDDLLARKKKPQQSEDLKSQRSQKSPQQRQVFNSESLKPHEFRIMSRTNEKVKRLVEIRKERSARMENKSVVVPGMTILRDVLQLNEEGGIENVKKNKNHIQASCVWATERNKELLERLHHANRTLTYCITSPDILEKIAGFPTEILAEIPLPAPSPNWEKLSRIVCFDEISDPGNVGSLIRSAYALGWEGIFVIDKSCDPFNDKAISAARGATFLFPVKIGTREELFRILQRTPHHIFLAQPPNPKSLSDSASSIAQSFHHVEVNEELRKKIQPATHIALFLGNETRGVDQTILDIERHQLVSRKVKQEVDSENNNNSNDDNKRKVCCVHINMKSHTQLSSLNVAVAGGIVMHALSLATAK